MQEWASVMHLRIESVLGYQEKDYVRHGSPRR
jgi:hypothetical protein